MPKRSIAIIGGGMAGLASAATLVKQGQQVTLFEASAYLGGRARGIEYHSTRIDNGQHILLGAYSETLKLLKLAGVNEQHCLSRLPLTLHVKNLLDSQVFNLKANPLLPAPLHILLGLLSAGGVTLSEKFLAIRFMAWMRLNQFKLKQDQPLAALLKTRQQSPKLIQFLWEPLCLAALNTPISIASAQIFLNILRDSFSKKKSDADVLLARVDLSDLISKPIAHYIRQNGGFIHTSTPITHITQNENGYLLHCNEITHTFSHVIFACGPHQLSRFADTLPGLAQLTDHFNYQPITTIYLQYPSDTKLPLPMIGSVNSLSQWIFDRGQICGQVGLIAVVISAHQPFKHSQNELAELISEELSTLFPDLGQHVWHKVISEKRATFSCNSALTRPENKTSYPNLYLAGDFTKGDYPATIEGAIRSGIDVAKLISKD
ncbi:MAG: hydroxysqualene dehydroxylase HpnE [Methylophilus sp.]